MQALGGPAEMKLGGHCHERVQLAQLHSLTEPPRRRNCTGVMSGQESDCSAAPNNA